MIWARVFLVAIITGISFLNWKLWDVGSTARFMISAFSVPLMFAAAVTFFLSFLKADTVNGRLVMKGNNPFVRFATFWWGDAQRKQLLGKMDVCAFFWLTVLGLCITALVATLLLGTLIMIGLLTRSLYLHGLQGTLQSTGSGRMPLAGVVVMVGSVFALIGVLAFIASRIDKARSKSGRRGMCLLLFTVAILHMFFIVPIMSTAWDKSVSYKQAFSIYLRDFQENGLGLLLGTLAVLGVIGAVLTLIFVLFRTFKALRDSFVGRMTGLAWHAFKSKTCPIIIVSDGDPQPKEAPNGTG